MTKEEAKKCIKSQMCKDCSVYLGGGKCSNNCKVIEIIKTLEKEGIFDVLDKLRIEIERKIVKRPWLDFEDRGRDRNDAFLEALDIIDKYK